MFLKLVWVVAVAVSFLGSNKAFAEVNMRDGMWEMTMKTEVTGITFDMQPVKFNQCMTKKDPFPQNREKNKDCNMISTRIEGNTVYWKGHCRTKDGTVDSDGKITYDGDSLSGVVKTITNDARSGKMVLTNHLTGRRIGDCK